LFINHPNWGTKLTVMPQSLCKLYIHLVFSTKYRESIILPSIKTELFSYMGGILQNLECIPLQIGGVADHVHVLSTLSKKLPLVKLLEELKRSSSKWMKTKGDSYNNFYWQDGYGAFSVGYTQLEQVTNYINNQEEHHKIVTFQDEYRQFLKKYQIEYDERYVWD
jgi:putative transposase